ncbi:probable fdxN element excision controlling factor protein [Crocosphaera subtropica ATCC 51142]|uniref:Probable fdxN element excision controlling factor protein n=1 Tax=Crocosphaera subtropica (strain ATCC 51142 / BH68) TaxID=43989 RepID=B1WTD1_CROS5|nr:XisH family protein [Crocosphaera subtropica]ACB52053.1 probable fdxN element excision controlling factor protein [Crocosphaera subtropica ATCC 51142]
MSAKDIFHSAVRKGLEKEGWIVTDDPLRIEVGDVEMYVDLGAEQLLAAERNTEKIAVEIKSFIGKSSISEFHTAIGQCLNYRIALEEKEPERQLYLAIPLDIYYSFFELRFIQTVLKRLQISLIIYDAIEEVIVTWKN